MNLHFISIDELNIKSNHILLGAFMDMQHVDKLKFNSNSSNFSFTKISYDTCSFQALIFCLRKMLTKWKLTFYTFLGTVLV